MPKSGTERLHITIKNKIPGSKMNAILRTRIYEKQSISRFEFSSGSKEAVSDCGTYRLSLKLQKTAGKYTYFPQLDWIADRRPQAGLELLTLEIELPEHGLKDGRIFFHGYQSWSLSASHDWKEPDESPKLAFLQYSQENIYSSHSEISEDWISEGFILALSKGEEQNYFAGVIGRGQEGVKFRVRSKERLMENSDQKTLKSEAIAIYDIFRYEDFKGNKLPLTPIRVVKFKGDESIFLKNYFSELGRNFKVKLPQIPVPTGWCSWYHYYTKISEKIILKNLKALRTKNFGVKVFQIDDGYQTEIGDWLETNERFPGGMKLIADAIKSEKFTPGIWLAPFLVRKKSKFFQKYPEAVLKDRDGNPVPALWNPLWGFDFTYTLDVSHPASKEFLTYVIRTIVKEYGYEYLKLDFLYSALLPGWTYDRSESPHTRYIEAIKLIRKAAGKDVFLLGCGAPIVPSIGLFDAMRISCDVAPFWGREKKRIFANDRNALCTERALINDITRASMHRTLWFNDPDCLLVRDRKNKMTSAQTKIMASVMGVSGGMLFVSDEIALLTQEREDLLKKTLYLQGKCRNKTPLPIGIGSEFFPSALYNPAGFLGIWNPSDTSREIELNLTFPWEKKSTIDYWTGQIVESLEIEPRKKILKIRLGAWESVVLSSGKLG
ncbi:glycoside hydrolase, family 31 domain protein [Leptospira broomii serovar Hurstbridge str. 5399]|uniref:Glycoside hydrolase, family 31 domain protein n=2 Tax=Leptospira broomii TaxID=301541 RepID=T0F8J8_9LEPT|nr:glycoside hydrolase, family 31 domain protein [Leptospira broomii serovar Hurstbridge str. 5399]